MKFPWSSSKPLEIRQDVAYTDVLVKALLAAAGGEVATGLTAGVEICAGQYGRAFQSAELTPAGLVADAIRPHLGFIGRAMIDRGEAVFEISFDRQLTLTAASTVTVEGGADPRSWVYRLTLPGPSEMITRTLAADRVLHLVYARAAERPWRGVSPIAASGTTKKLLENMEYRLAQETGEAVGWLIPVPNVQSTDQLQTDIRGLKGQVTLVESTGQNWGTGPTGAPAGDYLTRRIGADPPAVLSKLRREAEESILAAAGVPITVLTGGQGTAAREAFRQFLHLTVGPVALELAAQVADAFELPEFAFSFDRLMASDLSGRARAFQSMVGGGMDLAKAAAIAGLMEADNE